MPGMEQNKRGGGMSVREAGQKGGETVKNKYGSEFYEQIGKKGGKKGGEGSWKSSNDGFCRTWKGAKEECFTIVGAGANQWSVLKGAGIVATWSK